MQDESVFPAALLRLDVNEVEKMLATSLLGLENPAALLRLHAK